MGHEPRSEHADAIRCASNSPSKVTRLRPWSYNEQLYRRRNEIERRFGRLKGFRQIFSRYDQPDVTFTAFILIAEALRPTLV